MCNQLGHFTAHVGERARIARFACSRVICCWLLTICCAAVTGRAYAQWEVGAFVGAAHTQNSDLDLRQPSRSTQLRFSDVSYRGESFTSPVYYGVRGGRFFRRTWGAQVEFVHLKVFANTDRITAVSGSLNGVPIDSRLRMDAIVQRFSISHGVNLLMANFVARLPLGVASGTEDARVALAFCAGAGATMPHPEAAVLGETEQHYQGGRPAIQVAATIETRLWRKLYWSGEYKYTRTRQEVDVPAGTARTLLQSHHLVTGPTVRF